MQIKAHFSSLGPNKNKGFAQHFKQETSSRLLNDVYFLHCAQAMRVRDVVFLRLDLNKPWSLQFKLTYQNHIAILIPMTLDTQNQSCFAPASTICDT